MLSSRPLLLMLMLASEAPAFAAPAGALTANDFAEGFDVTPVGVGALQRVYLPAAVYRVATRGDLGDLRVFNRVGAEVAFGLVEPLPTTVDSAWRALPIFPLPAISDSRNARTRAKGQVMGSIALSRIDVQLADNGAVVAIRSGGSHHTTTQSWLLDVSAWREPPTELQLAWRGGGTRTLIELQVQASSDLATWQTIVPRAALARLNFDGHEVLRNRVPLPPLTDSALAGSSVRSRYLAVRFTSVSDSASDSAGDSASDSASDQPVLTGVLGRAAAMVNSPQQDVRAPLGALVNGGLEYDTGGHYPIQSATIWPARANDAAEVRLLTRSFAKDPWRLLGQNVVYRVMVGGAETRSPALPITSGAGRWLRIEKVSGRFDSARDVVLNILWQRPQLVFLRQGEAPFTVAYGAGAVTGVTSPLPALLKHLGADQSIAKLPLASVAAVHTLGGSARLASPPRPIPWQQIALWTVLVMGVLMVGTMALRLLRTTK